jgi:4-amino-4-deoxy-L-arabinose transferase-like glycosyltransferase
MMERSLSGARAWVIVGALAVVSMLMTMLAMRRTSSTFDEIAPIAIGAYGWKTGDWSKMTRFPPVMQYLYGLPVYLSKPNYPPDDFDGDYYAYSRELLWKSGNHAEQLIFRARLVTVVMVGLLVVLTFAFARAYFDTKTGLLAATIVAFLPDVMGHGGVAYNDVPLAAAFLASLWAIDRAVRQPTILRGVLAGVLISVALGIKHSALALGPIAVLLIVLEAIARPDRRAWAPRIAAAFGVGILTGFVTQVLLYGGDIFLTYLLEGTGALAGHVSRGHAAVDPRGGYSIEPGWQFYSRALMIKTSAAFHVLLILGAIGGILGLRTGTREKLLRGGARAPLVALLVFGAILMRAKLVIGFRYALPMLPLLAILAIAGSMVLWSRRRVFAGVIVALVIWSAGSTLSFYPYFLAYSSEYPPGRDKAYTQLFDSSLDWGQGLIALREFMRDENVDLVYLAYFGSALPEGYGIKYVPLPSFYPLPTQPPQARPPKFAVVSATLLGGRYLRQDFYKDPREKETPYRVLGHNLFVFKADE